MGEKLPNALPHVSAISVYAFPLLLITWVSHLKLPSFGILAFAQKFFLTRERPTWFENFH
jgi:hypothetical protein